MKLVLRRRLLLPDVLLCPHDCHRRCWSSSPRSSFLGRSSQQVRQQSRGAGCGGGVRAGKQWTPDVTKLQQTKTTGTSNPARVGVQRALAKASTSTTSADPLAALRCTLLLLCAARCPGFAVSLNVVYQTIKIPELSDFWSTSLFLFRGATRVAYPHCSMRVTWRNNQAQTSSAEADRNLGAHK